jgi:hypothetical protein
MALFVTGITIALAAINASVKQTRAGDDCLAGPNTSRGSPDSPRMLVSGPRTRYARAPDASPARSSNTMSAQPASQTITQAIGAGPEPLTVEVAPVADRTKGVAAERVRVEKTSGYDADINDSEIEE